jgi:hypothetical protein
MRLAPFRFICEFFLLTTTLVCSVPWDLLSKNYINYNYLEVGFVEVDAFTASSAWTKISTESLGVDGNAVVFLSIPDVAKILASPYYPAGRGSDAIPPIVPKVKEQLVTNTDGTFSFEFKLITVNDSFCSQEWYDVINVPVGALPLQVAWLVAREGAYSKQTNYTDESDNTNIIIQSGEITRASSAPQATNSNGNAIQYWYPYGCETPELLCTVTDESDVPGVSQGAGDIQQLQTSRNTVDGGRDLFLSVRAWQVKKRSIWMVLVPHDSVDPTYFEITTPEIVAPTNKQIICTEGFSFESITFTNVTHLPVPLSYRFVYRYLPGVFGMIGSVVSMVDSSTLSVYDRSTIFVTKEDQCASEQTIHVTPEVVHVLIFGESTMVDNPIVCGTQYTPPDNVSSCFQFLIER